MSLNVYYISIKLSLYLIMIPIHVTYQEEWLSYLVRIQWRKLFLLCHQETNADVFLFGDGTLFLLPIFNARAPIWLEPLYACVYCCSLFQFMCSSISFFLGIFCYIWPWVYFCLFFWLPQLPDTWGKVFTKLSNWDWVLRNFTVPLHCCKTQG